MGNFVNTRSAVRALGVHPNTLRNWASNGLISYIRSPSGQRLYDVDDLLRKGGIGKTVCYCRVSSVKQRDDLERQASFLKEKYPNSEIIQDFGSGLNFKRKGLNSILERVVSREIQTIVVAHKDRLCRFGFDLFSKFCSMFGTQIVVLDETRMSPQQELVSDLISIIHVFSCRIYGLRKYSTKIKEDTAIPQQGTEESDIEMGRSISQSI